LKDKLLQLETRIDSMQLRERALLLFAGIATIFFLVDTFGIQPAYKLHKQNKQVISSLETELDLLRQRSSLLYATPEEDYLFIRDQLQSEISELTEKLDNKLGILLAPDQAAIVLEQVLAQEKDLKLLELEADSRPLEDADYFQDTATPIAGIGRYNLQLHLKGSYLATLHYLRALDALPWKFFWEDVDFEITEHPDANITIKIYTLGLLER